MFEHTKTKTDAHSSFISSGIFQFAFDKKLKI